MNLYFTHKDVGFIFGYGSYISYGVYFGCDSYEHLGLKSGMTRIFLWI